MIDELARATGERMKKSVAALRSELAKVRTGRAHASLLDHVSVEYYGNMTPLNQVANVTVEEAKTLAVHVWEKTLVKQVEKAIVESDLGLNPAVHGNVVRVTMPPLTGERRKELVKLVRREGEAARVAVRNVRRDANHEIKDALKDKELGQDDEKTAYAAIDKATAEHVAAIDRMLADKEKELTEM